MIFNQYFSASWGSWGSWGECSTTCNEGVQRREKNCENQIVGANSCPTDNDQWFQTKPCELAKCPDPCIPTITQLGETVVISHNFLDSSNSNGFGRESDIKSKKLAGSVPSTITVQKSKSNPKISVI